MSNIRGTCPDQATKTLADEIGYFSAGVTPIQDFFFAVLAEGHRPQIWQGRRSKLKHRKGLIALRKRVSALTTPT